MKKYNAAISIFIMTFILYIPSIIKAKDSSDEDYLFTPGVTKTSDVLERSDAEIRGETIEQVAGGVGAALDATTPADLAALGAFAATKGAAWAGLEAAAAASAVEAASSALTIIGIPVAIALIYDNLANVLGGFSKIAFVNRTRFPLKIQHFVHMKGNNRKDYEKLSVPPQGIVLAPDKGIGVSLVHRGAGSSDQTYAFDIVFPLPVGDQIIWVNLFQAAVLIKHRIGHSTISYSGTTNVDQPITPDTNTIWYTNKHKHEWTKELKDVKFKLHFDVVTKGNDSVAFIVSEE